MWDLRTQRHHIRWPIGHMLRMKLAVRQVGSMKFAVQLVETQFDIPLVGLVRQLHRTLEGY